MEEDRKYKILLVDDVEMNLVILSEIVSSMNLTPLTALSAKEAIEILNKETPHLILLDISMPDVNGLEFCAMLKSDVYTRDIPVIFISAMDSSEDLSQAFTVGAVDYIYKPYDSVNVRMRINTHLKLYNMQCELENANRRLNSVIKKQFRVGRDKQMEFYKIMAELAAERDPKRTYSKMSEAQMVKTLAQALQLSPEYEKQITDAYVDDLEMASILHDIGLIKIPDSIALKSEKMTQEEQKALAMHTIYGAEKVEKAAAKYKDKEEFSGVFREVILYHHENYDGTGYPYGLKGDEIPLGGRIMHVIDVYEALINDRCYRKAVSPDEAIEEIKRESGKAFDPGIVDIFAKIYKKFV